MNCRELFMRDHPEDNLEGTIMLTCPEDHGIKAKGERPCIKDMRLQIDCSACRACWEREAEE